MLPELPLTVPVLVSMVAFVKEPLLFTVPLLENVAKAPLLVNDPPLFMTAALVNVLALLKRPLTWLFRTPLFVNVPESSHRPELFTVPPLVNRFWLRTPPDGRTPALLKM